MTKLLDISSKPFQILFACICLFHWLACKQSEPLKEETAAIFAAVSSDKSGIDFSNDIKETEQRNFLTFPYYYNGGGVAVGDINGDQLPDMYFTGNMVGDRLYLNKGNLQFEDITRTAGILKQNLWTTGVTFADVNQDGLLDIYVCRSGMRGFRNNLLYINQGNNKFQESARDYGLNDNGYSVQAYFFDYDIDGDLDVYLVNHSNKFFANQEELFALKGKPEAEEADKLYRNDGPQEGSGQIIYTDVSQEAGINHFGFGLSASIADFSQDGLPDIYVANDFFEPDLLYINQGDGTFSDQLADYFGHTSFSSMGSDAADFNNDGLPDLMVCDMQAADNYRKKAHMASMDVDRFNRMIAEGYHFQYMQNTLQLNTGMGRFSEIAEFAGVAETDWSWGPLFFDMNNDGWKDLFVSNGIRRDIQYKDILTEVGQKVSDNRPQTMDLIQNFPVQKLPNYTFKNEQGDAFTDQSRTWGINCQGFSTGAAYADLDLDGDLDLVLNNLDDIASIYENRSERGTHYLQVELQGTEDNFHGVGAIVEIRTDSLIQTQSVQTSRGFQSSVEPILHFGLGTFDLVDELTVYWPNGTVNSMKKVEANQRMVVSQEVAQTLAHTQEQSQGLFAEITSTVGMDHRHQEEMYNDFDKEILLPHKYSQLGPGIAVGDVNGDGHEDVYIGGAKNFAGSLYVQTPSGDFNPISSSTWNRDKGYEDIDATFFDADGDGDQDLYVVSGSNEWEAGSTMYQDRLYLNNGNGNFSHSPSSLPNIHTSGACVRPADFDQDGDIDLFVGGRMIPGKYPFPAPSYVLENNGGTFSDITEDVCKGLLSAGMVTDAVWTDYDGDQDLDLMVVGEWIPIRLFENNQGKFEAVEIPEFDQTTGWWYSLAASDMDQDGDEDYLVGNLGLNYKYKTSVEEPFQVYAHDFDVNGSLDIVLGYFSDNQLFPLRGKQCSSEQMPSLKEKFPTYSMFAEATLEDVYGAKNLGEALHYQAQTFASIYIENLGNGHFRIQALPAQAQLSAVNDFVITDVDKDGKADVILAGNMFQSEAETARNDAGTGLVMLGNGKGEFLPMSHQQSGFFTPGDVKCLAKLKHVSGDELILVGNNADQLQIFRRK